MNSLKFGCQWVKWGVERKFGNIIWTNHALERLNTRGIKQSDAFATWRNPDQSRKATSEGNWIYYKTYPTQRIEVVAAKNEKGVPVILSVWSRPVYQVRSGTKGAWDKILESILNKLFGWAKHE